MPQRHLLLACPAGAEVFRAPPFLQEVECVAVSVHAYSGSFDMVSDASVSLTAGWPGGPNAEPQAGGARGAIAPKLLLARYQLDAAVPSDALLFVTIHRCSAPRHTPLFPVSLRSFFTVDCPRRCPTLRVIQRHVSILTPSSTAIPSMNHHHKPPHLRAEPLMPQGRRRAVVAPSGRRGLCRPLGQLPHASAHLLTPLPTRSARLFCLLCLLIEPAHRIVGLGSSLPRVRHWQAGPTARPAAERQVGGWV